MNEGRVRVWDCVCVKIRTPEKQPVVRVKGEGVDQVCVKADKG